jgi:hypothetical protein
MVISYLLGTFDSWAPMGNIVNLVWMMAGHQMVISYSIYLAALIAGHPWEILITWCG